MNTALALLLAAFASAAGGFDAAGVDKTAAPCQDLYQFACGGWLKANEIPADQSRWSRFQELGERNKLILRELLEARAADTRDRGPIDRMIGDYYAACMDEMAIESQGLRILQAPLVRVASVSRDELAVELARLQGEGASAGLAFGSGPDFRDARRVIAHADQGGLALPDRDYYLKADEKSVALRQRYADHVAKMLSLADPALSTTTAAADAAVVVAFEVQLASASQDRVFRREPKNLDHKMTLAELEKAAPGLDWRRYFEQSGAPSFGTLNVVSPGFMTQLGKLAKDAPLATWRLYLRWHAIHAAAPFLPKAFVEEDFAFFGKTLTGAKELKPRWKRCVEFTDAQLGEALGQRYVEKTFGEDGKKRMLEMVRNLETALAADIKALDWMTPKTKEAALRKLKTVEEKIGYPDKWRDYSSVEILRGDALGNAMRAGRVEWRRQLAKIGKPVDRKEWFMTPPTVNAYYDPQMNNINFPAGILQPPFFDKNMDDAVNYGGIGAVIGHELTHGFDDEGRQFDAEGNLKDWWTEQDGKAFNERAQCFVDQYSGYTAIGDVKVNGKLTLGENTADNGGLRIAHMALMDALKGKEAKPVDGFSPEQRLFLGWSQVWCMKITDEAARMRALTDPHSPGRYRVNGVVANMPEFAKAFSCEAPAKSCRVW